MKHNKYLLISLAVVFFLISCEKDLPTFLSYENYVFSSTDEDGGTWKPILINSGDEIIISAPSDVTSAEYLQELSDLKQEVSKRSNAEEQALEYWTDNPTIRWNEITLELIAKYNIIPGPNADGTYTLPNPNNPTGPPAFPFAHPPYAVRVLAYLSVAQFDGLITAWHYKYTYNRLAPFKQDSEIKYAYADNNIPSYPSDGAVLASVSKKILTAMFPLEAEYLEAKEAEHLRSLLLSGGYVESDIEAGKIIGNEIATKALERAATDGMKNAQTPKPVSDSIAAAAFDRFGWKWINKELPQRPVGLTPLYGKVKMWNVPNVELTRPIPPPNLDSQEYMADVEILKDYANNLTTERRRIANFWQDGLGTYTPPGHWNEFTKKFIVKYKLNPLRSARTFAYINMAMMDGGISCWDAKYYYHYPRPIQTIEGFKTIAGTPNFPSYTSGHSVFSAAGAEVLAYIFPQEATLVRDWAEEAAMSRVYGGIHWTFDAYIGTEQGIDVAQYTVDVAAVDGAD
ncbi:vanadium-dependent haloperoxidase [Confluentibacter flavum]|uniref:Phosphoesterase n=1 Tax=Confluentibacter flavum TaxID=1909700 RepID=A0A2N3HFI9_9FLAO|nr:vanadium-dependent haloperoxidase [Confluentibacter flavum]PKQ43654.1 phosphoesterase [Confluentibacter flavum]